MVICIVVFFICVVVAVIEGKDCFWDGFVDIVTGLFLSALLTAAFTGFFIVVCLCIGSFLHEDSMVIEKTQETPIIALKDNQNISGHFYLMGGYVNEDLYYYYAKETERGYKTEKVKADLCYIVYTEESPRIEQYTATGFKHWWTYIYAFPNYASYTIYVPSGTVTTEYAIDLE